LTLQLKKLPKIISNVRAWESQPSYLVGFKLLSNASKEQLIEAACESEKKNNADMIVANDLEDLRNNRHTLYLISGQKLIDTIKGENLAQKLWSAIQCGYNAKNKV
jgi:phosphopantothenate-cysteine ligase